MDVSPLCNKVPYEPWRVVEGQGSLGPMPKIVSYTACSVMEIPNLGEHEAPYNHWMSACSVTRA